MAHQKAVPEQSGQTVPSIDELFARQNREKAVRIAVDLLICVEFG
jgi:hypothetical protein